MAKAYDVWILSSNTVYKGVPFNVVTDWTQQGRLGGADKLRPAGTEAWSTVGDDPIISDFLFTKKKPKAPDVAAPGAGPATMDVVWTKRREDEDDDVDMIPLIDISLVLLIFFMMTSVASSLSPIDVPLLKNIGNQSAPVDALTVTIDKRPNGDTAWGLRMGEKPAEAVDDNLDSLAILLGRLDERLGEIRLDGKPPPEVRFACHRELPSERVHELIQELEKRKKDGRISQYRAEVVEKK